MMTARKYRKAIKAEMRDDNEDRIDSFLEKHEVAIVAVLGNAYFCILDGRNLNHPDRCNQNIDGFLTIPTELLHCAYTPALKGDKNACI